MGKKTGKKTAKIKDLGVKDAKSVKGGVLSKFSKVDLEYVKQPS